MARKRVPVKADEEFVRDIQRILESERERQRVTPPPPLPPPGRPRRREPQDPFAQAWREETLRRADRNYRAHKEIFDTLPGMADEPEETQLEIWRIYLQNMVKSGQYKRNDPANPFWQSSGISPRDFDWSEWRRVQGRTSPGKGRGK